MTGKFGGATDTIQTLPGNTYRCDAASFQTRGGRGCMFNDTDEIFARLSVDGGDFNVDSTTLEWLVVTPDRKVALKGTSKAAGRDDFGFVIYGYADDPNRFRIVVWPLAVNAFPEVAVVYDNRPGVSYDLDVADPQPTAGGSIQVH